MSESKDIHALIREYQRLTGNVSGNAQTINVTANAGVFGVWIATTCCIVMLVCGLLGSLVVLREFNRYDAEIAKLQQRDSAQQAYLSAIYAQAPHLKPKGK